MGPIARIRTDLPQKLGIPRNGSLAPHLHGEIRFEPEFASAAAVAGLEEFSHLWLIWQFENGLAGGAASDVAADSAGATAAGGPRCALLAWAGPSAWACLRRAARSGQTRLASRACASSALSFARTAP